MPADDSVRLDDDQTSFQPDQILGTKSQKARSTGPIRGLHPTLGLSGELLVQSELAQDLLALASDEG